MAEYKIGVCCTFGAGSSLMLKMNLDSVFKRMGVNAEVEVFDISSIKGMASELDAVFTSAALSQEVQSSVDGTNAIVIPVINYFDLDGLEVLAKENLIK